MRFPSRPWSAVALLVLAAFVISVSAGCTSTSQSGATSTSTSSTSASATPAAKQAAVMTAAVKKLQVVLTTLGYYTGPIDGVYGPATTEAVKSLQTALGVPVDGRYGPETHAALLKASKPAATEYVMAIQAALTSLGYYTGPIDGAYGPATVDAVKAFQTAAGITVDGIAGPETVDALSSALAAKTP